MYHYAIQPTYHHNVYQQCSVNPMINEIKSQDNHILTITNQYDLNTQNASCDPPDNTDKVQTPTQSIRGKSGKKTSVDTSNFSIEERLVAAVWVHERKRADIGISQIKRDFRQRFGREPPSKNTLLAWERKLFSSGSVCDAPRPGRPVNRLSRLEEVSASVRAAPQLSVRARARQLRLPRSTLRTILSHDLRVHTSGADKQTITNKSPGKQHLNAHVAQTHPAMKKVPSASVVAQAVLPARPDQAYLR